MKKNGFTLAEVLIALGIIGVVAALTAPALIQDVSNAKLGPILAKFKSSVENANRMIMQDRASVDLEAVVQSGVAVDGDPDYTNYIEQLTGIMAGSRNLVDRNVTYDRDDGSEGGVTNFNGNDPNQGRDFLDDAKKIKLSGGMLASFVAPTIQLAQNHVSGYRGPLAEVYIDIDGAKHGQNSAGFDIFGFIIDRNGALIPMGSVAYATYGTGNYNQNLHWRNGNCDGDNVNDGFLCTGSIFENNQKVIYK